MHVDEMRLGLQGQVRRVWASKGVKVIQKLQFVFEWAYLLLGVDPITGELRWDWLASMRQDDLHPALKTWQLEAVIWDRAASHRGLKVAALPFKRIFQPAYSPELNPVERIFEELRRVAEGRIYASLAQKKQVVENELRSLAADPQRVLQLAGWSWIQEAFHALPSN
jgi:transposase